MKTYTSEHIAEIFHVDPETVRRWARTGKLPGVHIEGAGWRFTEEDLQSFLETQRARKSAKVRGAESAA